MLLTPARSKIESGSRFEAASWFSRPTFQAVGTQVHVGYLLRHWGLSKTLSRGFKRGLQGGLKEAYRGLKPPFVQGGPPRTTVSSLPSAGRLAKSRLTPQVRRRRPWSHSFTSGCELSNFCVGSLSQTLFKCLEKCASWSAFR